MDTTYFGRRFDIMVLMDSISGKALFVSEVKNETNELYAQAIGSLRPLQKSLSFDSRNPNTGFRLSKERLFCRSA